MDRWKAARVQPGQPAPEAGMYEEHNAAGEPTGMNVMVAKGDRLPGLPRGFFWRLTRGRFVSFATLFRSPVGPRC